MDEYVVVGILKGYREAEEATQDLELAGITGGEVQLITDTNDDARTIDTPGEKSTRPPNAHPNWLERLFDKGGALERPVRADSGDQPDYIGDQVFYATHVKEGGAILIIRTPNEPTANRAAKILEDHGARTPGQKTGPQVRRINASPNPNPKP
ncbi:MAG TPA: hypothetical protein VGD60_02230 [Candidatus Acidoferrales bacterium]